MPANSTIRIAHSCKLFGWRCMAQGSEPMPIMAEGKSLLKCLRKLCREVKKQQT